MAIQRLSGRKNNHQQVDPGSVVRNPPPRPIGYEKKKISDKLPVLCLEFQIILTELPVTSFLGINKVIFFMTTVFADHAGEMDTQQTEDRAKSVGVQRSRQVA